jgi:hypothetical protein
MTKVDLGARPQPRITRDHHDESQPGLGPNLGSHAATMTKIDLGARPRLGSHAATMTKVERLNGARDDVHPGPQPNLDDFRLDVPPEVIKIRR